MVLETTPFSPSCYYIGYSDPLSNEGHLSDVPFTCVILSCSLQAVVIRIYLRCSYTVCSNYIPPSDTVEKVEPRHLLQSISSPLQILGDLNGCH